MTPDELVPDCVLCRMYFEDNAHHLVAACASVGIERGKPTRQMVAEQMAAIHREHILLAAEGPDKTDRGGDG